MIRKSLFTLCSLLVLVVLAAPAVAQEPVDSEAAQQLAAAPAQTVESEAPASPEAPAPSWTPFIDEALLQASGLVGGTSQSFGGFPGCFYGYDVSCVHTCNYICPWNDTACVQACVYPECCL